MEINTKFDKAGQLIASGVIALTLGGFAQQAQAFDARGQQLNTICKNRGGSPSTPYVNFNCNLCHNNGPGGGSGAGKSAFKNKNWDFFCPIPTPSPAPGTPTPSPAPGTPAPSPTQPDTLTIFTIDDQYAKVGDEVSIPVVARNAQGIVDWQLKGSHIDGKVCGLEIMDSGSTQDDPNDHEITLYGQYTDAVDRCRVTVIAMDAMSSTKEGFNIYVGNSSGTSPEVVWKRTDARYHCDKSDLTVRTKLVDQSCSKTKKTLKVLVGMPTMADKAEVDVRCDRKGNIAADVVVNAEKAAVDQGVFVMLEDYDPVALDVQYTGTCDAPSSDDGATMGGSNDSMDGGDTGDFTDDTTFTDDSDDGSSDEEDD